MRLTVEMNFRIHVCPVCGRRAPYQAVFVEYRQAGAYVRAVATQPCDHQKDD
jgi:hypothetical protein